MTVAVSTKNKELREFSGRRKFRLCTNMGGFVEKGIKPGWTIYRMEYPTGGIVWSPVSPSQTQMENLRQYNKEWYLADENTPVNKLTNSRMYSFLADFIDPNKLNALFKFPPAYLGFPPESKHKDVEKWILEHFNDVEFEVRDGSEYRFLGEYNGKDYLLNEKDSTKIQKK